MWKGMAMLGRPTGSANWANSEEVHRTIVEGWRMRPIRPIRRIRALERHLRFLKHRTHLVPGSRVAEVSRWPGRTCSD